MMDCIELQSLIQVIKQSYFIASSAYSAVLKYEWYVSDKFASIKFKNSPKNISHLVSVCVWLMECASYSVL